MAAKQSCTMAHVQQAENGYIADQPLSHRPSAILVGSAAFIFQRRGATCHARPTHITPSSSDAMPSSTSHVSQAH
eukprot:27521-Eustigmatos_ZCMA.PRE.1